MFAITLELLSGRYIATAYNDRSKVEWPPHPARLFSALTSTWADNLSTPPEAEREEQALRWLEQQSPPIIYASPFASPRDVTPVFVPVNDTSVISAPSREKLDLAAEGLLLASEPKAQVKAQKIFLAAENKFLGDMAKAIAGPSKTPSSADLASAIKLFPENRTRQPRTFPCATPEEPLVVFSWEEAEISENHAVALRRLLSRLVRVGHSSSFVRATLVCSDTVLEPPKGMESYHPDDTQGDLVIRWVGAGQLDRLQAAFDRHTETDPRVLPARFVRYRAGIEEEVREPFSSTFESSAVIFARVDGPRLPITAVAGVAHHMRRSLMRSAITIPSILSGHNSDATPNRGRHLAIVPLPFVNGSHADGTILGVALLFPRDCDPADREAVMQAVARFEAAQLQVSNFEAPCVPLVMGPAGKLILRRVAWGEDQRASLQMRTWTRPSRIWASATPVALDRNPGNLHHEDPIKRRAAFEEAEAIVSAAVVNIGLPTPAVVEVHRSCVVTGTSKPIQYPRFPMTVQYPQRVLVHVKLFFDEVVQGPVLIGSGRYRGLGLCVPLLSKKN